MSGTQDKISSEQNLQSQENSDLKNAQDGQAGSDENAKELENIEQEVLTPAQKMDKLLRKNTSGQLKKEIERLRKEAAKYRKSSQEVFEQKNELLKKTEAITNELQSLRETNRNLTIMRALDNAGCIKSELVVKDIPLDCEDITAFIEEYKENNSFLFKTSKKSVGSSFKSFTTKNLTPAQQMDAYIRASLRR